MDHRDRGGLAADQALGGECKELLSPAGGVLVRLTREMIAAIEKWAANKDLSRSLNVIAWRHLQDFG